MTNEEAIAAFKAGKPVYSNSYHGELVYLKISAIIYRMQNGAMTLSVELLDKCKHSVTITSPSMVHLKEE